MTNKLSLLTLCIIIHIHSFAQENIYNINLQIIYKYTYQTDSLDIESKKQETMELLVTNTGETLYQSYHKGLRDSIVIADRINREKGIPSDVQSKTRHHISSTIFKSNQRFITRDSYINTLGRENDNFYYQEDIKLNWELQDQTDSIHGIHVQKAICQHENYKWTVWFAHEIDLPYGPYKFSKLPGLILKVEDDKGYFSFEIVSIKNKVNHSVRFPNEEYLSKKYITKAQYLKEKLYYLQNRTIIDIQNKRIFFDNEDVKREAIIKEKERFKKSNIWIERFL